ncbi:MAG: DUF494 family protein [Candidatus Eisenbacteria bacterium]
MNEHVKGVLRRIVLQLRAALDGDEFALDDLHESLASSGASGEEIEAALDSIFALTEPDRDELPDAAGSGNGNRVLSLEERSRLTPEAYGYLLGVRSNGAIDEEQFEWVLERALALGERSVGLDEIQDLVLDAALGGRSAGGDRGDFPGIH